MSGKPLRRRHIAASSEYAFSPPTRTVNANEADKKIDSQFKSSIVINRIEYTDGSIWQRDSFTPPDK